MEWVTAQNIEPGDVLHALSNDPRWPRRARDPVTGLEAMVFWGRTSAKRAIVVATRRVSERDWEIIGARYLSGTEEQELANWEERRRGRS